MIFLYPVQEEHDNSFNEKCFLNEAFELLEVFDVYHELRAELDFTLHHC